MKDKDVIKMLNSLKKIVPGDNFIEKNRSVLYTQISNSQGEYKVKRNIFKRIYSVLCGRH